MPIHHLSPFGAPLFSSGSAVAASVATQAALTALGADHSARVHGNVVMVDADGSEWYWHSTSTLTADNILVDAADDAPSAGRWLRKPGRVALACPFTYATADNAVLLTIPTGAVFKLESAHWKVTTGFTGGTLSAIGVSSSIDTTQGDILGGATGDVAATLVAGRAAGTVGAKMDSDSELHAQLWPAGTTAVFDRITSAFTAGAGSVVLVGDLIANAGA